LKFSASPLRSLRLSGECFPNSIHRRDAEVAETYGEKDWNWDTTLEYWIRTRGLSGNVLHSVGISGVRFNLFRPLAVVDDTGCSREHNLAIIPPFDWNQTAGCMDIHYAIRFAVDD
jgi:hypothetical protein